MPSLDARGVACDVVCAVGAQVTVRGLYEALSVHSLPHKWRYHVSRWPLDGAHTALEHERAKDAQSVIVLSIERD